jgi:uncharacterized membrane protein YheB (UPF0754 family)
MLFHPYHPIKIGKFKLPFTPGVIPKRKEAIAQAVGNAIENDLISREDLKRALLSEEVKKTVIGGLVNVLLEDEDSLELQLSEQLGAESYEKTFATVEEKLCTAAQHAIEKLDVSTLLSDRGVEAIEKYLSTSMPMVSLFLSRDKLKSIVGGFGNYLTAYLSENAAEILREPIHEKMHVLASHTPAELLRYCRLDRDLLEKLMHSAYSKVINEKADSLLHEIHIGAIAQEKIRQMDSRDLEMLTLSVMKREMNTVVNLGAVLGALIGMANIFI